MYYLHKLNAPITRTLYQTQLVTLSTQAETTTRGGILQSYEHKTLFYLETELIIC